MRACAISGRLVALRVLDLRGTQVSDQGLARLETLRNLRALYLEDTRVTRAGKEQLAGVLTQVTID